MTTPFALPAQTSFESERTQHRFSAASAQDAADSELSDEESDHEQDAATPRRSSRKRNATQGIREGDEEVTHCSTLLMSVVLIRHKMQWRDHAKRVVTSCSSLFRASRAFSTMCQSDCFISRANSSMFLFGQFLDTHTFTCMLLFCCCSITSLASAGLAQAQEEGG